MFQLVPTAETYCLTIEALCTGTGSKKSEVSELVCSVCQKMIAAQRFPDGEKMGRIISWLCRDGTFKEAHAVYMAAIN